MQLIRYQKITILSISKIKIYSNHLKLRTMKKLILIFVLVAAYSVSMANVPVKFFNAEKSQLCLLQLRMMA